tara:strand:- start:1345 stop:1593 length:249 start_codon:yes stop_codon:yes gene_type:complete
MSLYLMASILILSSAYEKSGVAAAILWSAGLLASVNAGMYFWEWSDPEDFNEYIKGSVNWRVWTVLAFWTMTFVGAVFALTR